MSDILTKVEGMLKEAEFFLVSVRELNQRLRMEIPEINLSDDELADILRGDERFRLFSSSLDSLDEHYSAASLMLLEEHGITVGPRVMLRNRVPTKREVINLLLEKANQTFETLIQAWDMRPPDDEHTEDKLLEALAKAQRLQRQLSELAERDISVKEREDKSYKD